MEFRSSRNVYSRRILVFSDTVLTGGKVVTMDANEKISEAAAIKFDKILPVGSNEEIRSLIGPETKVID